jgi:hypothetical protein
MVVELNKRNPVGETHISVALGIYSDSSIKTFTPSWQKYIYFLTCYSSQRSQQKVWR